MVAAVINNPWVPAGFLLVLVVLLLLISPWERFEERRRNKGSK